MLAIVEIPEVRQRVSRLSVEEPKPIAPDEIRGKEINGGGSRRSGNGDVVVAPNGVPHWFQAVDGPMLYYMVKVTRE